MIVCVRGVCVWYVCVCVVWGVCVVWRGSEYVFGCKAGRSRGVYICTFHLHWLVLVFSALRAWEGPWWLHLRSTVGGYIGGRSVCMCICACMYGGRGRVYIVYIHRGTLHTSAHTQASQSGHTPRPTGNFGPVLDNSYLKEHWWGGMGTWSH